jgi:hypothetical protein
MRVIREAVHLSFQDEKYDQRKYQEIHDKKGKILLDQKPFEPDHWLGSLDEGG